MNWKITVIGGICFYIAQFLVSMATGPFIHEGILTEVYKANASFWRPELNEVPPNMAALMPMWITNGIIGALVLATVYGAVRSAFTGSGAVKGIKYGFALFLITAVMMLGWSGVFNLPMEIWMWWAAEGAVMFLIGGAVLGFVSEKLAPEQRTADA